MRILMISLDKKILEKSSPSSARMVNYGKEDALFIIIPNKEKKYIELSATVHAYASGGGTRAMQFFKIIQKGMRIIKDFGIEEITAQDPFFTGLAGFLLKCCSNVRLNVQIHGDFYGSPYYKSGIIFKLRLLLGKIILKRADSIRAVGERVRESIIKLGVSPYRIVLRSIQVDSNKEKLYDDERSLKTLYPEHDKVFLSIGRFDPVKNIPWLVSLFKEVVKQRPKAGLVIVGDGEDRLKIEKEINTGNLNGNVHILPWTNDPISYIKTSDCLLFPSVSEGYGLVVLEAKAVGTPVIMADVGVANYEVKQGNGVSIVPVGNKESFIKEILNKFV